ncbi:MAG: monovalent cation/H(+) antiporter subunit G [Pseudomonadota bacterium]|nr:monovalent cation/H(+) antiporter subunit G [Pseudomonadota bacterium]
MIELLSWIALVGGSLLALIGSVGLLRFPDFFARLHAASVIDTLGAGLIIIGLLLQAGWSQSSIKLLLIAVVMFIVSPTVSHALARAARISGQTPAGSEPDRPSR